MKFSSCRKACRGIAALAGVLASVRGSASVRVADLVDTDFWTNVQNAVGVPVLLAIGSIILVVLVLYRSLYREVGKRQLCEEETGIERDRLNAILNKAGVGVQLVDRRMLLVDVNHQWCRMFGLRRHDVRGHLKACDQVYAQDVEAMNRRFREILAGTVPRKTRECRFVRKNGSVFWGMVSLSSVEGKDGACQWVVAMITDIDAQKNTERALRESEERLRFITDNTHDIVWQLDSEYRFTFINGADERLRGYPREQVIGHSFREQIVPDSLDVFDRAMPLGEDRGEGRVIHFEVEICRRTKAPLWVEVNSTPIRDARGKITGYIGVSRDVTHLREKQRVLHEQAIRDSLSGLFNRRFLDESLPRELARAGRDNLPLSVIMIDIDHFKRLNDTYGHPAGDEVIRQLALLMQRGARGGDLICRYGGEEFLLVLPNMALAKAVERAEAWRVAFGRIEIAVGEAAVSPTFSAGVAEYPRHGETASALIQAADKALYAAKHAGRNRVLAAG